MLEAVGTEGCQRLFSDFSCPKNPDLEIFLKTKSIRFEQSDNSRTYLILDSESTDILAYFSISFKEVSLTQAELSKNQVKKLDGINKHSERVRAYLIGQIGKNFAIPQNPISLPNILEEVYAIIEAAQALVGGRAIILECGKVNKLIDIYRDNGFDVLIQSDEEPLVTMYTYITD
ncbi:hypothetical protein ACN930_002266 [Vibrio parahaemolyticus]|uniref:Acetyltransferase n=2 Tax=Vibrio TaxID=662 RepID=A0AA47JM00_VIBPH|nr:MULTISPECIES: hypothetical protein [Vibrio]EIC5074575.1 hypothetical protein [Vibrio parahaemolyticus]EIT7140476.1 hypothetical protein [Vibrio parahaemolyticus]EIV8655093.1 hypothetical protein [Vibrio parahaemolyticus]EKD9021088.1 hypothetical protein [Vibrio parahaemolyticus]EKG9563882.1 hypothetical protein [Vibrio parahaemolyticus]